MGKVKKGLSQIDPTTKDGLANLATGGLYGASRNASRRLEGLMKGPEEPGETESEKAAADTAVKEYDFARQLDFVKDEYAARVERMGTDEMQNAVSGRANIDAQRQVGGLADAAELSMQQQGVDPSSGRANSIMTSATAAGGDAIGGAQAESEFALDSAHLEGKNNRIAMAMGKKTKAVAGLQDIAEGANRLSIDKARNKFNSKAATSAALGTAAGLGASYLQNREDQ